MPQQHYIPPADDAELPPRYPHKINFITPEQLFKEAKEKGPAYVFSQDKRALKIDEVAWRTQSDNRKLTHTITVDHVRFVGAPIHSVSP